jgi:hypothetical protein
VIQFSFDVPVESHRFISVRMPGASYAIASEEAGLG